MPLDNPVRGNAGIVLKIGVNGAPAVQFEDAKSVRITSEDKDDSDLTFLEAASGDTKDYLTTIRAVMATAVGTLWRTLWDNPAAELSVTYGPHGNEVASPDEPHFLMVLKADGRPELGNEAKRTKDREEFEYEFEVIEGPTLDDGTP